MVSRGWWLGALMASASLVGGARADDDLHNLKLKSSPASSSASVNQAELEQMTDDDIEQINLRYRLGYWRGSNGVGYIARFYAFRSGHAAGSGGGFAGSSSFGGQGDASAYNYGGGPSIAGGRNYGAAPNVGGGSNYSGAPAMGGGQGYGRLPDYSGSPSTSSGSSAQPAPPPARLPMPSRRPGTLPIPQNDFRPMPEPSPILPPEPEPKRVKPVPPTVDGIGSRLASDDAPRKKLRYPAYGEHLRSSSDGETLYANQKK